MHGVEAKGIDCPAIDGIIEEAEEVVGEVEDKAVLNAALAAAAQAAEHYEISRYGTLVAWAKQLGRNDCARVLQQNLDEEKAADRKLTEIAEARLNLQGRELKRHGLSPRLTPIGDGGRAREQAPRPSAFLCARRRVGAELLW